MENLEKTTHKFYETMAQEFSNTRYKTWPKVKEFLASAKGLLLDAGCGNGRNMINNAIGIDFSFSLLQKASKRETHNSLIQANIINLPFLDSVFDNLLSIAVIHHLNTHERRLAAMKEMYRILKTGGKLLIYVWDNAAIKGEKFKQIYNDDYMVDWKNTGCLRYYHMFTFESFIKFLLATEFKILDVGVEQESLYAILQK